MVVGLVVVVNSKVGDGSNGVEWSGRRKDGSGCQLR